MSCLAWPAVSVLAAVALLFFSLISSLIFSFCGGQDCLPLVLYKYGPFYSLLLPQRRGGGSGVGSLLCALPILPALHPADEGGVMACWLALAAVTSAAVYLAYGRFWMKKHGDHLCRSSEPSHDNEPSFAISWKAKAEGPRCWRAVEQARSRDMAERQLPRWRWTRTCGRATPWVATAAALPPAARVDSRSCHPFHLSFLGGHRVNRRLAATNGVWCGRIDIEEGGGGEKRLQRYHMALRACRSGAWRWRGRPYPCASL